MIRVSRDSDRDRYEEFTSLQDAIDYKADNHLGGDWSINACADDIETIEDHLLLAGVILHDHISPVWRSIHLDRLARGQITRLPANASEGMGKASAVMALEMLEISGHKGWQAQIGSYLGAKDGTVHEHGWLRRMDGAILDIAAGQFCRTPILGVDPGDDEILAHYRATTNIKPGKIQTPAATDLPDDVLVSLSGIRIPYRLHLVEAVDIDCSGVN